MSFTEEQTKLLQEKLDSQHVSSRKQSGISLSYLEGYHVIDEANRIFGFDKWGYTVDIIDTQKEQITIGAQKKEGHYIGVIAKVYLSVDGVYREDVGFGSGRSTSFVDAHELAYKEAVTDALKRAFRSFGNQFGNALYDKTQKNVEDKSKAKPKTKSKPKVEGAPRKETKDDGFNLKAFLAEIDELSTEEELLNFRSANKGVVPEEHQEAVKKHFNNHKKDIL